MWLLGHELIGTVLALARDRGPLLYICDEQAMNQIEQKQSFLSGILKRIAPVLIRWRHMYTCLDVSSFFLDVTKVSAEKRKKREKKKDEEKKKRTPKASL